MRCNECRDKFSEYLDARLSPDTAEQVERHLASCARCARELDDLRALLATVRNMPAAPVPEGFVERVHRRVAPLGAPRRAPVWRWVAVSAATAVLALAALAVFGPTLSTRERARLAPSPRRAAQNYGETDRWAPEAAPSTRDDGLAASSPAAGEHDAVTSDRPAATPKKPAESPASGTLPPGIHRTPPTPLPPPPTVGEEASGRAGDDGRRDAGATTLPKEKAAAARLDDDTPIGDKTGTAAGLKAEVMDGAAGAPQAELPEGQSGPRAASAPAPPYTPGEQVVPAGKGAPAPAREGEARVPMLSDSAIFWVTPQQPPSWCLLTLRKPAAPERPMTALDPTPSTLNGSAALALQSGVPDLLVESRVEARSASLRVRRLARTDAAALPRVGSHVAGLRDIPLWQAAALSAGAVAALPLDRLAPSVGAYHGLPGAVRLSAVYRLTLSAKDQPDCVYLLFVPPSGVTAGAAMPPGPAVDVLRALTAQCGVTLLTPDISVGAPQLALTPMPPRQALAGALQMLGLTATQDASAWTAR